MFPNVEMPKLNILITVAEEHLKVPMQSSGTATDAAFSTNISFPHASWTNASLQLRPQEE